MATAEGGLPRAPVTSAERDRFLSIARLVYFTPVREYPPLGDRKAAATLAASGLMVTVLLFFVEPIIRLVEDPRLYVALPVGLTVLAIAALLVATAGNAFHALFLPIPPPPTGLAFYPQIAARPRDDYREAVKRLTDDEALEHMLHYNYSLATQSTAKFKMIERGVNCLEGAFIAWLILMALIALVGTASA